MTITPVPLPASPGPRSIEVRWGSNSVITRSPLSGATQVSKRLGGAWILSLELPPMTGFQSAQWQSVLYGLDGYAGVIEAGPLHPRPVDSYDASAPFMISEAWTVDFDFASGMFALRYITVPTILANGGDAAGSPTLDVDGMAGIGLNAGDWFSLALASGSRALHQVRVDAFPNGSGEAELKVHPPLRAAVANNAPLTIENPKGSFVFASAENAAFVRDERGVTTPETLQLVEFIVT